MAKRIDKALAARLRVESEETRELPYSEGVRPARPNRSQVYSVRLSTEEQAQVDAFRQAERMLADAGLVVPVYSEQIVLVCTSGVSGLVYPQSLGWISFKTAVRQ